MAKTKYSGGDRIAINDEVGDAPSSLKGALRPLPYYLIPKERQIFLFIS